MAPVLVTNCGAAFWISSSVHGDVAGAPPPCRLHSRGRLHGPRARCIPRTRSRRPLSRKRRLYPPLPRFRAVLGYGQSGVLRAILEVGEPLVDEALLGEAVSAAAGIG